ncbi:hypothetical protein [Tenacibaculum ovolyticum]|uniref:hypothetical protein n=1 Tax=Tenacibaculum ovolyticum TaxID=104270 RepID=UPI001F2E7F0C|nr:hypothetical protein [Tenacibaculum ovolyticum]
MKLFGILIFALSFTQCASIKLEATPPFTIKSASYSHITGGLPGNSSLNLMIEFSANKSIDFKNVYFQNRIVTAVIEEKQSKNYIAARYKTSTNNNKADLVLNADSKKEYGNTAKKQEKFPFELKENEAIVSYKIDTKTLYYKIEGIKKERKIFMPSSKPQN